MKVAFLDRDGVINREVNYLHTIEEFEYIENCKDGLLALISLGYEIVIITNQAGIAKGIFSLNQYDVLTAWMLNDLEKSGIKVLECMHCPHHPEGIIDEYTRSCDCRKPNPGMIQDTVSKYKVDLSESILVGDKVSDIKAGEAAGVGALYLVQSGHMLSENDCREHNVYKNLSAVASILLEEENLTANQ